MRWPRLALDSRSKLAISNSRVTSDSAEAGVVSPAQSTSCWPSSSRSNVFAFANA